MRGKLAFIAAVVALGLGVATPAFAYGPNAASITTSTSTIGPGGTVTVVGSSFVPGETITLVLHSTPVTLGTTTADPSGSFSANVTIPSDTPAGAHTVIATGSTGDSSTTDLTVTGATPSVAVAVATPDLPFTGADIAAVSSVGAIALALGGMLLLAGRRRRQVSQQTG
jgi:hypothetical protein